MALGLVAGLAAVAVELCIRERFYYVVPVFVLGALAFFACDAIWGNFTLTENGQLDGGAALLMVLFLGAQALIYRIQWKRAQAEEEGEEQ